jgi:hypothetical protein
MKSGFRYFCFICASLLATQMVAADMSGWSDKTVCRLVKAGGGQEHIDEATKRGLDCASPTVKSVAASSSSTKVDPLDALTIPKNWQPIKNQKVFDQERRAVKLGTAKRGRSDQYKMFAEQCYDIMYHLNDSLMYFWKNQTTLEKLSSVDGNTSDFKPNVANCLGYYANLPGVLGDTPKEMMQLLEIWAEEDTFSLPQNRADKSYGTTVYGKIGTLTVLATYYALYYDEFQYSTAQRDLVDGYLTTFLLNVNTRARIKSGSKQCDPARLSSLAKDQINDTVDANSCGSTVWKTMAAQLLLGLRLNNEAVFKKGISNTQYQLNFFDKEGTFVTWANKGASSMQYTGDLPTFLGLLTEIFATIDYDFMSHKIPNGLSIKQVMDRQVDIYQDHKLIWKYAKTQTFPYKGVPTKEFLTWSSEEALDLAGTNLKTLVREMARYVDTYRPDLQNLRDQNYVFMDDRGKKVDVLGSFHAIEPYKLYEANTKEASSMLDVETVSLSSQRAHTIGGLVSWLKSIKWEGSLDDALSLDGSLGDAALADGVYALHYMRVSNYTGKLGHRGIDKLTVLDGSILFEAKPGYKEPVQSQRKTMRFETNNGLLIATGDLQYELDDPIAEVTFRGVIGTNFLIGTTSGRDIVMLHLTKW